MTKRNKKTIRLPRSVKRLFPEVTVAFDADEAVEVKVEKRDSKEGVKKDPGNCAMARAIKREYNADGAIIGLSTSYIIRKNKKTGITSAIRFATPESVAREITSFDRHQDFEPGEYILTTKPPTLRFGSGYSKRRYDENSSKRRNKSEKSRKIHKAHRTTNIRVLEGGASSK